MTIEKSGFRTKKEVSHFLKILNTCSTAKSNIFHFSDFEVIFMDDYIDQLLREERFCDVILPRLQVLYCFVLFAQLDIRFQSNHLLNDKVETNDENLI